MITLPPFLWPMDIYGFLWYMDVYMVTMFATPTKTSHQNPALGTLMQSLESKDELLVATLVLTLGPVICFCGLQNVKAAK